MRDYAKLLAEMIGRIRKVKEPLSYPTPPVPDINRTKYRLPPEQYVGEKTKKTGICLHHTVSGTANSVYNWWLDKGKAKVVRVGTAYVVDTDGTIYEFFDDNYWAFHLGTGIDVQYESSYIGIEIVSEGGLVENGGKLYAYWDENTWSGQLHKTSFVDLGEYWRGYRYFDQYEDAQIDSVVALVDHLCDKHDIERTMKSDLWKHNKNVLGKMGIITHAQVRADKTDVHPYFPTDKLEKYCKIKMETR